MDFGGRYRVRANRLAVWNALNNAEVLRSCIPGCKRIEWISETALEIAVAVNLGVAQPTFTGDLVLSDVVPAERYTLSGQGRGGLLGKAQAAADINLQDDQDESTLLFFKASGGASGQLMRIGKSVMGSSAQRIIDGFFERFGDAMGAEVTPLGPDWAP